MKNRSCSQLIQIDFVQRLVNVDTPKYQFIITVHELKPLKVKMNLFTLFIINIKILIYIIKALPRRKKKEK